MKESMEPSFGRPKTEHELQAQIENFAEQNLASKYIPSAQNNDFYENRKKASSVFKNSSELATVTNLDELPENISEDSKELIEKHKDAYLLSLKEQGAANIKFQTECLERYDTEFKPIVEHLRAELAEVKTGEDLQAIEGYISSGFEAHAFKVQTPSGVYVTKLFKSEAISEQQLDAMRKAKDTANVSHLVAYSQKEKAIIMQFFEGKNLGGIKRAEGPQITNEELKSILGTFVDLYKMDIRLDTNEAGGGNIMFDKEKGFFFIDYHSMNEPYSLMTSVPKLARAITQRADFKYGQEYENEVSDMNRRMIQELKDAFPEFYNQHKKEFEKGKIEALKDKIKGLFK